MKRTSSGQVCHTVANDLVVLQRVKSASVTVDGTLVASIGKGLLAFAAVSKDDSVDDSIKSASKLLKMRLWEDESGGKVRIVWHEDTS
jgi:D-Tyr-tRNAtyr deacylase